MKKIVASVGLAAFGALSLSASSLSDLASNPTKPWSASLTLRGFYDDNINGSHTDGRTAYGFEASPAIGLNWAVPQTTVGLNYVYSIKYYDRKPDPNRSEQYDQTHSFTALLDHRFSERYHISVKDSFVVGQEPDFLRSGNTYSSFQRISGSNIRNYGAIDGDAQITPVFGLAAGYANSYFHYDDHGAVLDDSFPPAVGQIVGGVFVPSGPSAAGRLDRIEQSIHLDGRWTVQPQTIAIVGYQYSMVDYIADEPIGSALINPEEALVFYSKSRNSRSHYGYVGADHTFRPDLTGSVRVGARFTDYYNDISGHNDVSPYAMASLRYAYLAQSYAEVGFSYDRSATDLFSIDTTKKNPLTTDFESASLWASVNHALTPKLIGSLMGQFQNSTFNGGSLDSQTERYYTLGLNFTYRFNTHFSSEFGYNYDKLDSEAGRSFDRNRVYFGGTASW